jgi:hypothetical protein
MPMRTSSWVTCFRIVSTLGGGTFVMLAACSSSNTAGPDAEAPVCHPSGGPVPGPADMHCVVDGKQVVQSTDMASCLAGDLDAGDGVGTASGDGGPIADGGDCSLGYGYTPTLYGQSGSDDDCKYDVQWTSTPICENQNVYFTVTATRRTDHMPVTGASIVPEVVLDCTYPILNAPAFPSPEGPPGTYKVGPIVFDMPGKWTVRFHFFYECYHLVPTSPHGHAAFWVNVP